MPFVPGQSGNPAGRPRGFKGVARLIAEATGDGAELVQWALDTWRDPERSFGERAAAHAWLSDRFMGKPLSSHEVVAGVITSSAEGLPPGWWTLSPEERSRIIDERMRGGRAVASPIALALAAAITDED
jgi:hypothetical protein